MEVPRVSRKGFLLERSLNWRRTMQRLEQKPQKPEPKLPRGRKSHKPFVNKSF